MESQELREPTSSSRSGASPEAVRHLHSLCEQSLFLQAWRHAQKLAPIDTWRGPEALCVASRLLRHLGAETWARQLIFKAYQRHPRDALVRFYLAGTYVELRGLYATWQWLKQRCTGPASSQALLLGFRARLAIELRDFSTAELLIAEASKLDPNECWFRVLQSQCLEGQDQYPAALAALQDLLNASPPDRLAVHQAAHLLDLADRCEEALTLMRQATRQLQSASLVLELARLHRRVTNWEAAGRLLDEYEQLAPLLEESGGQELAAFRFEVAYHLGDFAGAIHHARQVKSPIFETVAERLQARQPAQRQRTLNVAFVRQHRLTCVPACLTMLARYFHADVKHLEVAERICYDGTSAFAERSWAETEGWLARELTVTWATACELIERGIPFVVNTVEAVSAHAQLIVGFDERRKVLLIRDPFIADLITADATEFLKCYAPYGPRGFLLLPSHKQSLFEGLELPEAELHDLLHDLHAALEKHHREEALGHLKKLEEKAPDHRLTLLGRRAIAAYDANPHGILAAAEGYLKLFPKEPTAELTVADMAHATGRPEQALAQLEAICKRDEVHPVFLEQLAEALLADGREHDRAGRMLRTVVRAMPRRGGSMAALARWCWNDREFEPALELMRFATCLEPTKEHLAQQYFTMMLTRGRGSEAVDQLSERVRHLGKLDSSPAMTLFSALEALERPTDAFALLKTTQATRRDDAQIALFAAEAHARYGQLDAAQEALERVRDKTPRAEYLRTAAVVAEYAGDVEAALESTRELCTLTPLSTEAQRRLAALLATLQGRGKAQTHLRQLTDRWPQNASFAALVCEWCSDADPEEQLGAVQHLLGLEPRNAWAQREEALLLARLGHSDQARAALEKAHQLAPNHPNLETTRGRVYEALRDVDAARAAYRASIREHPDEGYAILRVFSLTTEAGKLASLTDFVERRVADSVSGDGIRAFHLAVRPLLSNQALLERMERLRSARSNLWVAWSENIEVALECAANDRALELATTAAERFPMTPGAHLDLAATYRATGEATRERKALETALKISPTFVRATLELEASHRRNGDLAQAGSIVERALCFRPLDVELLVARADLARRAGDDSKALACIDRALQSEPTSEVAWARLAQWAVDKQSRARVMQRARAACERHHWDARMTVRLAELVAEDDLLDATKLVERATALDPEYDEAHDLLAILLARLGRRDAALAACSPAALSGRLPVTLRGREAWIHAAFGDVFQAISTMRAVLASTPRYGWGLWQLANWCIRIEDVAGARAALRALQECAATEAHYQLLAAELLEDLGDLSQAEAALRHALTIDPSLAAASTHLIALLARQWRAADVRAVHARYRHYLDPLTKQVADATLHLVEGRFEQAQDLAKKTWIHEATPAAERQALASTFFALAPGRTTLALYRSALESDAEDLGMLWYLACMELGRYPSRSKLKRLLTDAPNAGGAAVEEHISRCAAARDLQIVPDVLLLLKPARKNARTFAAIGEALYCLHLKRLCLLWYAGHESLDLRPAAFLPLLRAQRAKGKAAEAIRLCRTALRLKPDRTAPTYRGILAFELALAGEAGEGRELLEGLEPSEIDEPERLLHPLTVALLGAHPLERELQEKQLQDAIDSVDMLTSEWFIYWRPEAESIRRMSRKLARAGAGVKFWVRGYSLLILVLLSAACGVLLAIFWVIIEYLK